eukprot:906999-Amphidinium_carterae.1
MKSQSYKHKLSRVSQLQLAQFYNAARKFVNVPLALLQFVNCENTPCGPMSFSGQLQHRAQKYER